MKPESILGEKVSNNTGTLYVVATPIGHLEDITYRAVKVLEEVDLIAAEDTRHSAKLLLYYGIHTPLFSLHEHNEQQQTKGLLVRLREGESVALISDAGTPLINDPGYRLVSAARTEGLKVSPIPGPCAAIAALSAAGLPGNRFVFEGFLPAKAVARRKRLQELADEVRTLVFYESSHRILQGLDDIRDFLGPKRQAVIARELTKTFETLQSGSLRELCNWLQEDPNHQRGEFVILVVGETYSKGEATETYLYKVLSTLLMELPLNSAVRIAVNITGAPRNKVYQLALALKSR